MPFRRRITPAGETNDTEAHMPFRRRVDPAGDEGADTQAHMPFRRRVDPAGEEGGEQAAAEDSDDTEGHGMRFK